MLHAGPSGSKRRPHATSCRFAWQPTSGTSASTRSTLKDVTLQPSCKLNHTSWERSLIRLPRSPLPVAPSLPRGRGRASWKWYRATAPSSSLLRHLEPSTRPLPLVLPHSRRPPLQQRVPGPVGRLALLCRPTRRASRRVRYHACRRPRGRLPPQHLQRLHRTAFLVLRRTCVVTIDENRDLEIVRVRRWRLIMGCYVFTCLCDGLCNKAMHRRLRRPLTLASVTLAPCSTS
jgi:hypothetical protein